MEPVSALIIALVSAWYMSRGAAEAAVDQARAEARTASAAIRDDLRQRGQSWADDLGQRLAAGRSGGPFTGLWWGWAGLRAFQALRNGLRSDQDHAGPRSIRGPRGPFGRIWDAGTRGARFARDEHRRQRADQEKPRRVPVGVCGRCRAVVARAALAAASPGGALMCATCRAATQADKDTTAEKQSPRPKPGPADDIVDADVVVKEPRPIAAPRPELVGPVPERSVPEPSAPELGSGAAQPPAAPKPVGPPTPPAPPPAPSTAPQPAAAAPAAAPPEVSPPNVPELEGEPMAPRSPGQLAPTRRSALPAAAQAAARGTGGESYTHGQWQRAVASIEARLDELPLYLELMLRRLTTADAGRSQVEGVVKLHGEIGQYVGQVRDMLARVNRKEQPVLNAVDAAGGPEEIAGIPYLSEV